MARAGYDFQLLTLENRDWKEAGAVSKEIIQFDDAMFETKLDAIAHAARYERNGERKATGQAITNASSPLRPASWSRRCRNRRARSSGRRWSNDAGGESRASRNH